jgi:methylenetetrahydrofolate reductase (NADPH)
MNNLKNVQNNTGNPLLIRSLLNEGRFFVLFETDISQLLKHNQNPVENFQQIRNALNSHPQIPAGTALLNYSDQQMPPDAPELAAQIFDHNNPDIIYLCGKAASAENIRNFLNKCIGGNITSIVPVTGNSYNFKVFKNLRKPACFDSSHTLHIIKKEFQNSILFPGTTVNPFKYEPDILFAQYFKLIKKLNFGANFIIAQAGWDMMKYQELRWYLNDREYNIPTAARFLFLNQSILNDINNKKYPGIFISRDFNIILEKENKFSHTQFEAAQWRRLQIVAAGLKLMGYSAIQIAGLTSQDKIITALNKIDEAFKEMNSFSKWLNAYSEHFSRSDMAPFKHRYYMFNNLFNEQYTDKKFKNNKTISQCSFKTKLKYFTAKKLFSQTHLLDPGEYKISKKLLMNCRSCAYCRLPLTHYICPETCPKGLANGPCGGSSVDGHCEVVEHKFCIHIKRVQIAAWLNEIDTLEERYIRHPNQAEKTKM